jgi:mRNA interferase YafQ
MQYQIVRTRRFKKAFKRIQNLQGFKSETFIHVVETLASGKQLDKKYRDHKLSGNLKDFRECHLAPDILLLYQRDGDILVLTLVSIGNHAQLFK